MTELTAEQRKELDELARQRVEDLPGEPALGNAEPAAGGRNDPERYEGANPRK